MEDGVVSGNLVLVEQRNRIVLCGFDGWDREIVGECGSGGSGGGDEAQATTFMLFGNDHCK